MYEDVLVMSDLKINILKKKIMGTGTFPYAAVNSWLT